MRYCQPRQPATFVQFDGKNWEELIELVQRNSNYSVLISKEEVSLWLNQYHYKSCEIGEYLVYLHESMQFAVLSQEGFNKTYKEDLPMCGVCPKSECEYSPEVLIKDCIPKGVMKLDINHLWD